MRISERPTYGYRRVWAALRNQDTRVNKKTVRKALKDNNLNLPASKHRGRTKSRNLFKPTRPDQPGKLISLTFQHGLE